jgi:hypothetical protein
MDQSPKWLPNVADAPWSALAEAMQHGLPVPTGFVVAPQTPEAGVRAAYEELKIRSKTHFVAVRSPVHALINVIGSDALLHTLRRFWTESPEARILVQQMIHSAWCGSARWHRKNLRIKANEGMMMLDPDTYLIHAETRARTRRTLEPKQRKTIRHVDGTLRTVSREGNREPMTANQLKLIADLARRAQAGLTWAIDDLDRIWLISLEKEKW